MNKVHCGQSAGISTLRGNRIVCIPRARRSFAVRAAVGDVLLEVKGLEAKIAATGQQILKGVNLTLREGEVHAIMGKNGSGKSTLSKVLVGHPDYEVIGGSALYKGKDLFVLEAEERSHAGLFLSFQSPVEIPGVSNIDFLRIATNARRKALGMSELDPLEFYAFVMPKLESLNMDPAFLNRNVNEGFSGGEKKRNEILQLACLEADCAILDEIDSGLDIDALRDVATAVNGLKVERPNLGILMVTHYKRLLDYIKPDKVHIMQDGKIVTTGDMSLVDKLEEGGYKVLSSVDA
jgi:Fe-S cluster assembly ATP-binding protein